MPLRNWKPLDKSAVASAAIIAAGVVILVTPICGDLFACGCDWPWRGLAQRCNYFETPSALRCPWCEYRTLGVGTPLLATAVAVWTATRLSVPTDALRSPWVDSIVRGSLGLAAAVALLFLLGQLAFTVTDYPRP